MKNWTGLLCLAGLLVACRSPRTGGAATHAPAASATRVFQVQGLVKELRPDGRTAVIQHETIPGYMAAMTMPFTVKDAAELRSVEPGDRVTFRMTVSETDAWIDQVRVLEKGAVDEARPVVPGVRVVREVDELEEGDLLPDYPFLTESRRPVRLAEFKGQALGLTFIYTRCPYPTFCPRQSRQFAEACQRLKAALPGPEKRWHLLSISFDPAYDTPAVLRRYARQYDYDPAWWNFCTGEMIEIDAITEQFGMFFARDGANFDHNVRTVVVNREGRIQRIFVGNEWRVEDFVAEMIKAAGG